MCSSDLIDFKNIRTTGKHFYHKLVTQQYEGQPLRIVGPNIAHHQPQRFEALILGLLDGLPVVCLAGRLHMYEGHSARLVVEPVLLMGRLGAPRVLLTNAAGGVNPAYAAGTLMLISDHINLTGRHPLIGPNDDALGPRFPDLINTWDAGLRDTMRRAATEEGIELEEGIYIGLTGPSYETPAEVRMLRALGADAVGMSTVLEAVAARWAGIELVGVSLVTNLGAGVTGQPLNHEEVLAAGQEAGPRFSRLVRRFARLLSDARAG